MILPLASLALGFHLVIAVADQMPNLAVDESCKAQASRTDPLGGSALGGTLQGCLNSEHAARDKLKSEWNSFNGTVRERCHVTATMGGEPSYVELLTCLEMAKQAAELHNGRDDAATAVPPRRQPR